MVTEALAARTIESQGFELMEEGPNKKKGIVGLNPGMSQFSLAGHLDPSPDNAYQGDWIGKSP
jgi:hypothetical protein